MRVFIALFSFVIVLLAPVCGQDTYNLSGHVIDKGHSPLPGAVIIVNNGELSTISDNNGEFEIHGLTNQLYTVEISFLGYKIYTLKVNPANKAHYEIVLEASYQSLQEVVVSDHHADKVFKEDSRTVEVVNKEYIKMNLSGSLMSSLERLPGISTISIGSGQAKPVIRGLGFNRVVVAENGIKHESQQWGTDHGLEIDQFAAERIEIVKGPSSLMYGSDAIAGLINIRQIETPPDNTVGGSVDLSAKTNNKSLGSSVELYARKNKLFISIRGTVIDYADFKVPTDTVYLYTWAVPLHNNQVRNTAGNEYNWHLTTGYVSNRFSSRIFYSSINTKSGFFANAAGLEPLNADAAVHDKSDRDILMPHQNVTHTKLTNYSVLRLNNSKIEMNIGYQNNFRQEWMVYSAHGNMPVNFPEGLPFSSELEKEFTKNIVSANTRFSGDINERFEYSFGANVDYQINAINGKGFLIPGYTQLCTGGYAYGKFKINSKSIVNAGTRYDFGNIETEDYYDWYEPYQQRAWGMQRQYSSISYSLGYNYNSSQLSYKVNAGKSFRVPLAKELAANGFNAHMFRVEKGDSSLLPEISYQLDAAVEWQNTKLAIGISPFVNYFPNFIYLNPTSFFDEETNKQVYQYAEAEVFRYGAEFHAHYNLFSFIKAGVIAEYVFSKQLSGEKKGYTLPFSPPPGIILNLRYNARDSKLFHAPYISVDYKIVKEQNNIVPPEIVTPGYQLVNLNAGTKIYASGKHISVVLQVNNLFNTKYFNHTSYYRVIDLPEAGRNISINVSIPFSKQLNTNSKK